MAKTATTQAGLVDALTVHLERAVERLLAAEHRLSFLEDRLARIDSGDTSAEASAQARRLVANKAARVVRAG